jgi:hypothetical protein
MGELQGQLSQSYPKIEKISTLDQSPEVPETKSVPSAVASVTAHEDETSNNLRSLAPAAPSFPSPTSPFSSTRWAAAIRKYPVKSSQKSPVTQNQPVPFIAQDTVNEISWGKSVGTIFETDEGRTAKVSEFLPNKRRTYCWLMVGDIIRFTGEALDSPIALSKPPFVLPPAFDFRISEWLAKCGAFLQKNVRSQRASHAADFILASLREKDRLPDSTDPIGVYEQLCNFSVPRRQGRALRAIFDNENDRGTVCSRAEVQRILDNCYKNQTLRRLYNLQITNKDLRDSGLSATQLYKVCLRIPYLIPAITMEHAELICNIAGIEITEEMKNIGYAARELWKVKKDPGHLAVPVGFLRNQCPCYDSVESQLKSEKSITVFGSQYWDMPRAALSNIFEMLSTVASCLAVREPVSFDHIEDNEWQDSDLDADQRAAIERALNCPVSVITGGAGTGKTRAIVEIAQQALAAELTVHIATFTGKATWRVKQAFNERIGDVINDDLITTIHRMIYKGCAPCHLVIFDESSMIPTGLFAWLLRTHAWIQKARLIFVGDANQLPPIGIGSFFREILAAKLPTFTLGRTHRFKNDDEGIAGVAKWILTAKEVPPTDLPNFKGLRIISGGLNTALEYITRIVVNEKNAIRPSNFKVLSLFGNNANALNLHLRTLFHKSNEGFDCEGKIFAVGEQVMMTHNDYTALVFNGEEGQVVSICRPGDSRQSVLTVNFDIELSNYQGKPGDAPATPKEPRVIEFYDVPARKYAEENEDDRAKSALSVVAKEDSSTREKFEALAELAAAKAEDSKTSKAEDDNKDKPGVYELLYSYALAVHKAQGSEWDNVLIYIPNCNSNLHINSLLYTAATRAKRKLWIVCSVATLLKMASTCEPVVCDPTHVLIAERMGNYPSS